MKFKYPYETVEVTQAEPSVFDVEVGKVSLRLYTVDTFKKYSIKALLAGKYVKEMVLLDKPHSDAMAHYVAELVGGIPYLVYKKEMAGPLTMEPFEVYHAYDSYFFLTLPLKRPYPDMVPGIITTLDIEWLGDVTDFIYQKIKQ